MQHNVEEFSGTPWAALAILLLLWWGLSASLTPHAQSIAPHTPAKVHMWQVSGGAGR